jgi:hypothetical protein
MSGRIDGWCRSCGGSDGWPHAPYCPADLAYDEGDGKGHRPGWANEQYGDVCLGCNHQWPCPQADVQ